MRKPYDESCRALVTLGLVEEPIPPLPSRMPSYDDEEPLGVSFFRTHLEDEDLAGLSLPRTFFGRSLVARCSWTGTDLSESRLCWNEFEDVDFSRAVLSRADLRASNYERCRFDGADLRGADLRSSSYLECSFRDAKLDGARVTERQVGQMGLDPAQRASVSVELEDEDDVPGGG
jgi:uncharacterized protein YjbI with pentapeptide repeats